jgi:CelD/BcsL family acetyltransferase involved in cellulose biosynthesis
MEAAQMTRKVVRPVKKPSLKRGSAVAKRAEKPFKPKKHKRHEKKASRPVGPVGPVRPGRIVKLADRRRKHEADRIQRLKLARAVRQGRSLSDYLSCDYGRNLLMDIEISVTVGPTEHPASMCDSVTGDNGRPSRK